MLLIRGAMLPDFETGTTTQADVLIRDGRFAAIAPHLEADCPIVEASGLLLLPGMADLHTHMVQSLTQGPLDDLNITQWLTRMLRAQWSLTEDEWYYGVLLGCLRSIRYGVTAINEMTYYPHIDAVVQAYQDAASARRISPRTTRSASRRWTNACGRRRSCTTNGTAGDCCARLPCRRDVRPARRS